MKLIKISFYLVLSLLLLGSSPSLWAKGGEGTKKKVMKTNGTPAATKFNINNVSTFFSNDGASDLSNTGDAGFQFPIGSGHTVFYESGFLYGGYVNGEWRVSGSTYNRGQVPGRILPDGTGEDPAGPRVRIYRVRRDYKDPAADYSKEITDEGLTKDEIYKQYDTDWKEWPADYGAPYEEVNGTPGYQADGDIPGVPGADQTIWFVCNDTDPTQAQKLYGSIGLGIEMQGTIWGYNQQNALGDALFRKYLMINKGGNTIDSCYVNMWSDPDLGGDAGDDFAGCDTTLSIGFIYNGDDSDPSYGSYIPASGFDFLQGPIVAGEASDQAIFKGQVRSGYKNMPMTAFYIFTQGVANWGDPTLGNYTNGALRVRNLFQGKNATLGTPFTDPLTGKTTKYCVPGDPVTGQGWVDGILFPKQDRRMGAVAGPFTLAAGDTQEVVVGQLAAGGVAPISRLGAVALLKYEDLQVQQAYNNFFKVPTPPKAPLISTPGDFDQKIVLSWGDDGDAVKLTEGHDELGYKFQGYVVYQLPSLTAQLSEGVAVATYDLNDLVGNIESLVFDSETNSTTRKFTKFGQNTGIKRYIEITKDAVRGGVPLANGTEYYFVVSAYSFNPDPGAVPNVLETLSQRVAAVPHQPNPGDVIPDPATTTVDVTHSKGGSDGRVLINIIDPTKLNGHSYEVSFITDAKIGKAWKMVDKTTGATKVSANLEGTSAELTALVDGMAINVQGAPNDFNAFKVTSNANGKLDPPEIGCFAFNGNGFPLLNGADRPTNAQQVGAGHWGIHTGAAGIGGSSADGGDASYATFLGRTARNDNFTRIVPYDWEIRFTAAGGQTEMAFSTGAHAPVPFEIWNTGIGTPDDPSDDYECFSYVYDSDGNDQFNLVAQDHPVSGGADDPETDWFYIYDVADHTPGTKGYDAVIANAFDDNGVDPATGEYTTGDEVIARLVLVNWNGGQVGDATFPANINQVMPETGTTFRIETTKPNVVGSDVFTFTAPSSSFDADVAKTDVDKINVFPNPYYGVNPREINKYQRCVTFSHLPAKATLRVFNLAGQLVRILHKDSPSQFTTWDLLNDNSFPVSSGIYIVHIDMPDLGTTKIVKLAVIQEQQILDHY
jgi:hypothetical protein